MTPLEYRKAGSTTGRPLAEIRRRKTLPDRKRHGRFSRPCLLIYSRSAVLFGIPRGLSRFPLWSSAAVPYDLDILPSVQGRGRIGSLFQPHLDCAGEQVGLHHLAPPIRGVDDRALPGVMRSSDS